VQNTVCRRRKPTAGAAQIKSCRDFRDLEGRGSPAFQRGATVPQPGLAAKQHGFEPKPLQKLRGLGSRGGPNDARNCLEVVSLVMKSRVLPLSLILAAALAAGCQP